MGKKKTAKPDVEFQPPNPYSESESEYWGTDRKPEPVQEADLEQAAGKSTEPPRFFQCFGDPEFCSVFGEGDECFMSAHCVYPPKHCPWGLDEFCEWKEIPRQDLLDHPESR